MFDLTGRTALVTGATGGIGGVHRGAASSFDISADLTELGITPVAVTKGDKWAMRWPFKAAKPYKKPPNNKANCAHNC